MSKTPAEKKRAARIIATAITKSVAETITDAQVEAIQAQERMVQNAQEALRRVSLSTGYDVVGQTRY